MAVSLELKPPRGAEDGTGSTMRCQIAWFGCGCLVGLSAMALCRPARV
jgi:hypothetical protein